VIGEVARQPFAFAGAWRAFNGNYSGEHRDLVKSSMVTTAPNELDKDTCLYRMPVILRSEAYEEWLRGNRKRRSH